MSVRNLVKYAQGQAHRAEILAILEHYDWRASLAPIPPAKVIRSEMMCDPLPALRTVQWHITELARIERNKLRVRNLFCEH
jgi:hypothetical protein